VNDTLNKYLGEVVRSDRFRNLPSSQAMAVLKGEEGRDYLIVRVERFEQGGGPVRGNFLEFTASRVLACIGSVPPMNFLNRLGIKDLHAVDQDVEALGITPWFESCRKNVFLVGEPLSPAYILTTDFRPEADQVTVIQHAGSFKQSLRDGVLAVEAIHERLAKGASDERLKQLMVEVQDEWKRDFVPDDAPRPAVPVAAVPAVTALFARIVEGGREVPFSFPVGAVRVDFESGQVAYGKAAGNGATLLDIRADGCYVSDGAPEMRTMLQIGVERTIAKEEIFFAGSQALAIRDVDGKPYVAVLDSDWKAPINLIPFETTGSDFGRRKSRSVAGLDAADSYLSRRHFRIQGEGAAFTIRDYGSMNGTFVGVRSTPMKLVKGDTVWIGRSGFRFDGLDGAAATGVLPAAPPLAQAAAAAAIAPAPAKAPAPVAPISPSPVPPIARTSAPPAPAAAAASAAAPALAPAPAPAPTPAAASAAPAPAPAKEAPAKKSIPPAVEGPPSVRIRPIDKTLQLDPEKSLLNALQSAGLATTAAAETDGKQKLLYSCNGVPSCYLCIVKVLSGAANLNEISKKESKGIKLKTAGLIDEGFEVDPAACRLACLAQAKGPVEVEFLGNTDV
jgi:ferredoxin